jgi:Uma2 family endonuclease
LAVGFDLAIHLRACGGQEVARKTGPSRRGRAWYSRFMAEPSRQRATYQDVLDAPKHLVAEIINGDLRLISRPAGAHCAVASSLGDVLAAFKRGRGGPGGWIILGEPELHFGEDVVVPDLAGWRIERMPLVENVAYFTLAPDWLCEVLSKSTEKTDRSEKLPIYAANGIGHVWLINPIQRTLEVMRRLDDKWLTVAVHRDDQRVRAEPFDAVELDLAILWADLAPPPPSPSRASRASEPAARYELADD